MRHADPNTIIVTPIVALSGQDYNRTQEEIAADVARCLDETPATIVDDATDLEYFVQTTALEVNINHYLHTLGE